MLSLLGTLFTSIISGGMTGIFGVAVQRFADFKNKQLDIQIDREKMAHECEMRKVDADIMAQEWAARTKISETEVAGASDVAESNAFAASFNEPERYSQGIKASRKQAWLLVILDFVRGLVRPSLTVYLCVLTTLVYMHARKLLASPIDPSDAMELVRLIVGTILYLTTTCCLWWFGTRNKQKTPDTMN